ncbi:MAG: hypothetical protein KKB03_01545 [Nanoarchaeota archaeon]|nr:hypothetical protein [Nanoarchaeota archaeon]MBU1135239.1 hypothetical protein [Nanoarchaeota archaeon]MBU2519911.1 hypothetical protein [Nanoarchaeota archaeon]
MFRKYGFLGILLIILVEINFILKIEPFATWYFPIIWYGYILLIDALIFKTKGSSYLSNKPKQFIFMIIFSAVVWWMFEGINMALGNWRYIGTSGLASQQMKLIFGTISFSTVIPAVFETAEFLKSLHIFDKIKLKKSHNINKSLVYLMSFLGIVCLVFSATFPVFFFPLIWLAFFLMLDPFNYLHKKPSIIGHLKDRRLTIPIALFVGATVCGFLWEFWNYWAVIKWTYSIPFVDFFRVFEMPVLGYLGYGPFGWELYAMYYFVAGLFFDKNKKLIKI